MRQAADMSRWKGRVDEEEGISGRRWHQVVQALESTNEVTGAALIGFACDAGVARNHGRPGASDGPAALRSMLGNMPVHRSTAIIDAGDVVCSTVGNSDGLEQAQEELADVVADLLERGFLPIVMGGGHEMAYGSFSGLARSFVTTSEVVGPRIGIINLDAHFDLRLTERASSGTPFRQISEDCQAKGWTFHYCCLGVSRFSNTEPLFERANSLGVRWRSDEEMESRHLPETLTTLGDFLTEVDHIYFTICLDVLPSSLAPGVSAPAVRGVSLDVIEAIVDVVAASSKLRIADIAELNPTHDIDQRTARVAARLVARVVERVKI
ncbi:formimidoylglutamase [Collimonas sp.]|jgi:formiminoglutamase|uniref:formimidoylglutamase n=1 Tax=Collimonas sp. TaxID=1963772 RepID=UPI002CF8F343|nr:formimidoylglutamase [Collimonas sp.]HWW06358.1 formimidoylglutamase [Collimonas sp.]